MPLTFADVINANYILLTTFTKDGRPKPTAIWGVPDGDRLLVITEEDSWKVKRIRNTPRVTVAVCDMRGKPKSDAVEAVAKILDKSRSDDVRSAVVKRYGLVGWAFGIYCKVRGLDQRDIGLEINAASSAG